MADMPAGHGRNNLCEGDHPQGFALRLPPLASGNPNERCPKTYTKWPMDTYCPGLSRGPENCILKVRAQVGGFARRLS